MSLVVTRLDQVSVIQIDRPPVNAMDLPLLCALAQTVEAESKVAGALVIAGRPGAFSAGVDLKAILAYTPEQHRAMLQGVNRVCWAVAAAPIPTVAAVTGHAIGGGFLVMAGCDLRIGAAGVGVYALPEVRAGIPFPAGAMVLLQTMVPRVAARRLALADQRIGPEEALALGVLDRVLPADEVGPAAIAEATRLAALPRRVYQRTKAALYGEALHDLRSYAGEDNDPNVERWLSDDTTAASQAVLKARKA